MLTIVSDLALAEKPSDGFGEVYQYYPSGLPWAEGEGTGVQNKKYNGKEWIEMHGYDTYDYGARNMFPAVGGRFMTVDPLAEKYPFMSPYVYCHSNPVNAIDPDGREIKFIVRQTGSNTILTYKNGNFWHSSGQRYSPGKESLSKTLYRTLAAYRKILSSGDKGLINKLNTLETSERTHWVEASQVSENNVRPYSANTVSEENKIMSEGKGIGTQTQFDFSEESKKDFKESEGVSNSDFTTVVHEMQHQYDYDTGKMGDSLNKSGVTDPAEKRAVNSENSARKIEQLPKRTTYGGQKIKGLD